MLKQYFDCSKKSQIRVLENHNFTTIFHFKFISFQTIEIEPIILIHSKNWIITMHSSRLDLKEKMQHIFKNDIAISESSIDILYFSLISTIV